MRRSLLACTNRKCHFRFFLSLSPSLSLSLCLSPSPVRVCVCVCGQVVWCDVWARGIHVGRLRVHCSVVSLHPWTGFAHHFVNGVYRKEKKKELDSFRDAPLELPSAPPRWSQRGNVPDPPTPPVLVMPSSNAGKLRLQLIALACIRTLDVCVSFDVLTCPMEKKKIWIKNPAQGYFNFKLLNWFFLFFNFCSGFYNYLRNYAYECCHRLRPEH